MEPAWLVALPGIRGPREAGIAFLVDNDHSVAELRADAVLRVIAERTGLLVACCGCAADTACSCDCYAAICCGEACYGEVPVARILAACEWSTSDAMREVVARFRNKVPYSIWGMVASDTPVWKIADNMEAALRLARRYGGRIIAFVPHYYYDRREKTARGRRYAVLPETSIAEFISHPAYSACFAILVRSWELRPWFDLDFNVDPNDAEAVWAKMDDAWSTGVIHDTMDAAAEMMLERYGAVVTRDMFTVLITPRGLKKWSCHIYGNFTVFAADRFCKDVVHRLIATNRAQRPPGVTHSGRIGATPTDPADRCIADPAPYNPHPNFRVRLKFNAYVHAAGKLIDDFFAHASPAWNERYGDDLREATVHWLRAPWAAMRDPLAAAGDLFRQHLLSTIVDKLLRLPRDPAFAEDANAFPHHDPRGSAPSASSAMNIAYMIDANMPRFGVNQLTPSAVAMYVQRAGRSNFEYRPPAVHSTPVGEWDKPDHPAAETVAAAKALGYTVVRLRNISLPPYRWKMEIKPAPCPYCNRTHKGPTTLYLLAAPGVIAPMCARNLGRR